MPREGQESWFGSFVSAMAPLLVQDAKEEGFLQSTFRFMDFEEADNPSGVPVPKPHHTPLTYVILQCAPIIRDGPLYFVQSRTATEVKLVRFTFVSWSLGADHKHLNLVTLTKGGSSSARLYGSEGVSTDCTPGAPNLGINTIDSLAEMMDHHLAIQDDAAATFKTLCARYGHVLAWIVVRQACIQLLEFDLPSFVAFATANGSGFRQIIQELLRLPPLEAKKAWDAIVKFGQGLPSDSFTLPQDLLKPVKEVFASVHNYHTEGGALAPIISAYRNFKMYGTNCSIEDQVIAHWVSMVKLRAGMLHASTNATVRLLKDEVYPVYGFPELGTAISRDGVMRRIAQDTCITPANNVPPHDPSWTLFSKNNEYLNKLPEGEKKCVKDSPPAKLTAVSSHKRATSRRRLVSDWAAPLASEAHASRIWFWLSPMWILLAILNRTCNTARGILEAPLRGLGYFSSCAMAIMHSVRLQLEFAKRRIDARRAVMNRGPDEPTSFSPEPFTHVVNGELRTIQTIDPPPLSAKPVKLKTGATHYANTALFGIGPQLARYPNSAHNEGDSRGEATLEMTSAIMKLLKSTHYIANMWEATVRACGSRHAKSGGKKGASQAKEFQTQGDAGDIVIDLTPLVQPSAASMDLESSIPKDTGEELNRLFSIAVRNALSGFLHRVERALDESSDTDAYPAHLAATFAQHVHIVMDSASANTYLVTTYYSTSKNFHELKQLSNSIGDKVDFANTAVSHGLRTAFPTFVGFGLSALAGDMGLAALVDLVSRCSVGDPQLLDKGVANGIAFLLKEFKATAVTAILDTYAQHYPKSLGVPRLLPWLNGRIRDISSEPGSGAKHFRSILILNHYGLRVACSNWKRLRESLHRRVKGSLKVLFVNALQMWKDERGEQAQFIASPNSIYHACDAATTSPTPENLAFLYDTLEVTHTASFDNSRKYTFSNAMKLMM
eukprot:TRINITY_DN706_c0_g1_i3.p1 TRINITY_DN706_c0_g1~~TRINITY_DN706_c0_g1_i3.p1  ORF type:complete len:951 (-),score=72.97 TRINITY_DN706_c0_g1_i3:2574-5426(-)